MSSSGLFRRSSVPQSATSTLDHSSSKETLAVTPHPAVSTGLVGIGTKSKKECFVFEPQQWRKTVCKNCFRTQPEHKQSVGKEDAIGGPTVILRRTDSAPSTTSLITSSTVANQQAVDSCTSLGATSFHDMKSGRDNNNKSSNILAGNAARAAARKIAAGQRGSEDHRSQTSNYQETRRTGGITNSGAQSATGMYSSASSIDARYIEELENDFFALEDKHEAALRERDELAAELEAKIRTTAELQATLEQYREKVSLLERRCLHMEEEIKSYRERLRLPESDQSPPSREPLTSDAKESSPSSGVMLGDVACSGELQQRLNEVEQLCQEVMEENEQLKEEVEEMQREIEEMHDHFQEDDRDAMRELQRDLEAANKSCRILQFKLRKAERRFEQCEAERANLEERLARLEAELYSEADVAHIRNLEEEIRVAKEVGVQLNNELDMLDERRAYFEEENKQLKEELQVSQNRRISVENELGRLRLEMEKVKAEKGFLDKGPLQVTDKNRSRQASSGPSLSREASFEEQQLQRELEASRERETDLSEQLRFSEEEVRKLKRKVKEFQTENEMLSKKIDRIYATQLTRSAGDSQQTSVQKDRGPSDLLPQRDIPPGQPPQLSANQLENELLMTRKQLNVVEEENVGLRSKVVSYEREINVPHREVQRTQSRLPRSTQVESQEHENLREQLNLIQDHLARIEHERDRLDGENRRLRCSDLSGKRVNERSSDFEAIVQENEALKQRMKEWDRKLRQISREVSLAGSGDRDHEWMEKYNDARETIKEQEAEVFKAKKRISDLQDENARLRAEDRKTEQRVRREREKNNSSSAHMSREVLAQEVKSLEEELDEVTSDLTAAREQACTAQLRVTYLEDNNSELRAEAERRERELVSYVFHLENKNQVYINLHQIVQERMEILQNEVDRLLGITPSDESMEASAESQVSALSIMSTGSDEVFEDQTENTKRATEIERQLRSRIFCLERLLKEEKSRSEVAEAQLEKTLKQNSVSLSNTESHLRTRQLDQLKKELEEKDELLEAKEEQVANLRSRIDQSRKMNVALRALMEKDTEGEKTNAQRVEANVEIASYRKEIESARKEMQIIRNNLTQAEKIRERLIKDNRELQEELKLREDSIFEQDDEIERRNTELRVLKANAESLQKELEQTKRDLATAKTRESSGSSGRLSAQIAQNERIRAELHETARELNDVKLKYEEVKRACTTAEEKFAQLSADTNQLKTALQEKDAIIIELNKGLQRSNEEVGQSKLAGQTALTEKINVERQLMETKNALALKEQECNQLQTRLHEASSSVRGVERLGSSQESGIGVSDSASSRDGTLSRRSAEVDRLRRELSMMRSEKDELLAEIKRLRTKLDKRAAADEQGRRDGSSGLIGLSTGNAYAKAIAAQQTTTKISLLNEHIATLNRLNAELKLQNESLQNNMLEYQRRYRSLKEQYEGEQEAWLTERVVLESKAKEQEDRKVTISTTRKLLQETTAKLFELEKTSGNKIVELQMALEKLENEKNSLESKLNQIEEHQKLPKVLQRFGPTVVSSRPSVLAAQSRGSVGETHELTRRLESTERTLCKLRNELNDVRSAKHTEQVAAVKEAESARQTAEQEAEDLRDRLLTMECYRQQAELFRHRQFEVEESAEREFKVWQEERDHLLYKAEEARVMVEQWCIQLQCRAESNTEKTEDPVLDVLKQMEKWCSSRGKIPCLKRRDSSGSAEMIDSLYSSDGGTGSVPASPAVGLARNAMVSPFHGLRSHTQRSTSMEWGSGRSGILSSNAVTSPNPMHYREGSLGLGSGGSHFGSNLRGSAMSLALGTGVGGGSNYSLMVTNRCGRSVSPEVSVRKLSNYPDPTPGFLVRPTSRQGSHDSLSSMGDYTQRSFTLPGKPPVRSAISPARRRFFEDASSAVPGSKPLKTPADGLKTTNETDKQGSSVDMATSVKRTSPAPDPVKSDNSPETHRKKGSSQPPPSALPSKLNTTDKSKPASTGLSIADRFAKWSSTGGKSGSKVGQTELVKEQDVIKKNSKKKDDETATKTRGKSPKSPEKSASKKPAGTASVEKTVSSDSSNTKNINNDNNSAPKAEKCESTPSASKNVKRSGSSSNISPAIMALRQKFATGR